MPSRRVEIRLHARAAELAGVPESAVDVAGEGSVAEIKAALAHRHPGLADLLPSSALATDDAFLADGAGIGDATRLHLIPPVSGG